MQQNLKHDKFAQGSVAITETSIHHKNSCRNRFQQYALDIFDGNFCRRNRIFLPRLIARTQTKSIEK